MKVLVFIPYSLNSPHFETSLEIIQNHLDKGDDIFSIHCNSALLACDVNNYHDFRRCIKCIAKRKYGFSLLSTKIKSKSIFAFFKDKRYELNGIRTNFQDIDDLKNYYIENFDIGFAVLSSIISSLKNSHPDINKNAYLVKNYIISAYFAYKSIQNYLDQHTIDRVYIYSGRYAIMRAALRACQNKAIRFFTYERGHDLNHYALFENTMRLDFSYIQNKIKLHWRNSEKNPDREKIASQYFLDRSRGVIQNWYSFVREQREDLLPDNWDPSRRNITIFPSSEDELAAVGDIWKNPIYESQLDALKKIIQSLSGNKKNIHIYIRHHPNLKGKINSYNEELFNLKADFVTVIQPESPVSTYALLLHSEKVLTFGSRVGIEAVFWGKSSILAGTSFYHDLGGTYNPRSHDEVIAYLKHDLMPKDKESALMYGYYYNTFGIPFKYFNATSVKEGLFKGEEIKPSPLFGKIANLFKKFPTISKRINQIILYITERIIMR